MEIEINYTIWIDIGGIINDYYLCSSSSDDDIITAIIDWCAGLDDCDYYNIRTEEIAKIKTEIKNTLGQQMTIENF